MKSSIIVLNYNGQSLLYDCLAALQTSVGSSPQAEIIIVDNASAESPHSFLQHNFPTVKLIENPSNIGFGAGNNVAIRQSDGDFIVLVNPDVIVSPNFIANLLAPFSDPAIGVVGSKLHYPDGNIIQHAGGYLISPRALPMHFGVGEVDHGQYETAREVEYVIGAAIAFRRSMLDEIGLFDEGFFLFFEEVDLCFRARAAGWKVRYEPSAVATHIESATVGKRSFFYYQQLHKGRLRFVTKHFSDQELENLVAAEIPHLAETFNLERLALQLAYQHILATTQSNFVARQMQRLLDIAMQYSDVPALNSAEITPRPFQSKWPLIARIRHWWNRIAAQSYADTHFSQQIAFNRAVVEKIWENDRRIEEQRRRIGLISAEISKHIRFTRQAD